MLKKGTSVFNISQKFEVVQANETEKVVAYDELRIPVFAQKTCIVNCSIPAGEDGDDGTDSEDGEDGADCGDGADPGEELVSSISSSDLESYSILVELLFDYPDGQTR